MDKTESNASFEGRAMAKCKENLAVHYLYENTILIDTFVLKSACGEREGESEKCLTRKAKVVY